MIAQCHAEGKIAMLGAKILEDTKVEQILRGGDCDPGGDTLLPCRKIVSPEWIAGHDVAGAAGYADFLEGINDAGGKTFRNAKIIRWEVVGVYNGAVLVGT